MALALGVIVLLLVLLLARVYVGTDPKAIARAARVAGGILAGLAALALGATGRIGSAFLLAAGAWYLLMGSSAPWLRWRSGGHDGAGTRQESRSRPESAMTRGEALRVLGLEEGASEKDIRAAHRRLILQTHPDKGGSSYLASKINEAKDALLRR